MDSQINYTTVWQTQRTYVPQLASHTTNTTSIPLPPIWSVVLLALLALNCKNLPLAWHYRITNAFSYVLRSQRTVRKDGELNVFDAVITESLSPLTEIDFNLHKSNSTYFSDVDIARTNLICTLFNRGIEDARFATPSNTEVDKNASLTAMVAGVSCTFKGEIKPFQRYQMYSRILCWDHKWFWIVTWFTSPPKRNPKTGKSSERRVFATAVSKCVWKKQRVTVQPSVMMQSSGLLPKDSIDLADSTTEDVAASIASFPEAERQRQQGLDLLESEDGLERLHKMFDHECNVLARRHVLDFSPILMLRIGVLFVEWIGDRAWRLLSELPKTIRHLAS